MPCSDCGGPDVNDCFGRGVKSGAAIPVALMCDIHSCKNYVASGSVVCYLPIEPVIEKVELPVVGEDWDVISPTEATQIFTAPDGTVVTYTVTRISGTGTLSSGGSLYGRKTVALEAQDGAPTRWQMSWDVPSQGPVAVAMGGLDIAGGEVLDNWSDNPDNLGILSPAEDGQEHIFEWWTALTDPSNSFQFDFTGTAIGDTMNFGPFTMWFDQETYYIREAFIFWNNQNDADTDCDASFVPELFDTKTNEPVDPDQIVSCDTQPATWTLVLCDETGTQFQRVFHKENGRITVQDHTFGIDGETYIPIGEVAFCDPKQWCTTLCINEPMIQGFDVFTLDFTTEEVKKVNGLTGDTIESHTPVGVDWGFASIYNPASNALYLLDSVAGEWHLYNTNNIAAGSTNLGAFGGDAIANTPNFGAFDQVRNIGYMGLDVTDRYEIDFTTGTVTSVPAITGIPAGWLPSSLSITPAGVHYIAVIQFPVLGPNTQLYTVDPDTGVATLIDTIPGPAINGLDYDLDNETGWYGVDNATDTMYFWSKEDGSDFKPISTSPGLSSPTINVGNAIVDYVRTPFQRCFATDSVGDITTTDYELDGDPLTIENEGWVGDCCCEDEVECNNPGPKLCYSIGNTAELEEGEWTPIVAGISAETIVPTTDGGNITFTVDRVADFPTVVPGAAQCAGQSASALVMGATGTVRLSWDQVLASGEPFQFGLCDIDPAEEPINLVPPPDSQTPSGDGLYTIYTYNDGGALIPATGITIEFTQAQDTRLGLVGTAILVASETRELIPFYDCEGVLTEYRDTVTDEVVVDPNIVECLSGCYNPGPKLCYQEDGIEVTSWALEQQLPTQAFFTGFTSGGPVNLTIQFENPTGGAFLAQNVNWIDLQGNGTFEVNFYNLAPPEGVPFSMFVRDIDPGETFTVVPAPDSIGPTGDGITTEFIWDDGTVLADGMVLTYVSLDDIGVQFEGQDIVWPGDAGEVTPFYDCEGILIEYRDVLTDEVVQSPNLVDCNLPCPTKSVTEVCYETERLIDAEITLHGGAWTIVGPNQATQTFELPDGSNVNFTLTRAVGGSEVSQGPIINGIETLNLTTPTNGPSTWGLVWDVPLTGRFTMLFDDFDNDGGVTINEQLVVIGPQAPDNAGDYQGNILNERVTFIWDTSLIGGTNVTFQINNAGVQIPDSINIAPITLTVPVEFAGAYPALASMDCNDIVTYYDANTLEVLEDPAIVPCESLKVHWMEQLCDRIDTITGLDLFFFNDADQEVQRVNAFTGAVEDSHTPDPAIDWGHGTVFDASGGATGYYYLYDNTAGEWHRYEAGNIAAGSVNLGPFGGDPIVGSLTFGAFDPTTGLGYVGFVEQTRYEVDFNTSTITALPGFTGFTGAPSSLSVTETGLHYMTGLLAGAHTILHTVDVATGVCTPTGNFINIGLNGADYDQDTLSGFYGIGNNNLYHWTELNGSDLETLAPAVFSGTLAVGNTVVNTEQIEFQRVYHKDLVSGEVTRQDHDLEGADYEVQGVVERCKPSCDDPLYVQQCIETWSELLRDENCVAFNRVYHKTLEGVVTHQDYDLSGNLYTPVGEVGVGVNCYDIKAHLVEIVSGGTWTPASIPANHILTGLSMNVIIEAVDSSVTDADGNIVTNIPAGLSMSWNVAQDYNTLVPPQSISAGTGGRIMLNMTMRDES